MLAQLLRGSGVIALGTLVGQVVVLAATPWLARVYSPADFGELALLLSCSNIAAALACGRYDLAIPAADSASGLRIFQLSVLVAIGTSSVVLFLLLVLKSVRAPIPAPLGEFMVVAGCVLAAGIQQAVIGLFTQARNYAGIAAIRLSQGTLFSAMAMFPGIGLVAAHALSFLATVPSAARRFTRTPPSVNGLIDTAKDHRAFPLQSLPGAVLDVVAFSICIWTVTFAYGSHDAGQFSQVQRLIGAPLLLISMSMTQVLLRITADQVQHPLAMRRLFRQIGVGALLAGTALVCVVAIAGESALRWILGSGWTVDPGFILPIALAVTVRACVSPLSSILVTLRRFDVALLWQAAYFVCAATTLGLAAFHLEFRDFLVIYAIHEVVLYAAYAFLIHRCVEKKHVRHLRSD